MPPPAIALTGLATQVAREVQRDLESKLRIAPYFYRDFDSKVLYRYRYGYRYCFNRYRYGHQGVPPSKERELLC